MDAKSKLLLHLAQRLPHGLPPSERHRSSGGRKRATGQVESAEVIALRRQLQILRSQLLEASRRNDFRAEARLKTALASVNKMILEAQHLPVLAGE